MAVADHSTKLALLWVLRDHFQDCEDPNEYLRNALAKVLATRRRTEEIQKTNEVKHHISKLFRVLNCFPLVRPTVRDADFKRLHEIPMVDFQLEFQEQLRQLVAAVERLALPTLIEGGQLLTAPVLAQLMHQFVDGIDNGDLPRMEAAFYSASKKVCQTEVSKAREELAKSIGSALGIPDFELEQKYRKHFDDLTQGLRKSLSQYEATAEKSLQDFKEEMEGELVEWRRLNDHKRHIMQMDPDDVIKMANAATAVTAGAAVGLAGAAVGAAGAGAAVDGAGVATVGILGMLASAMVGEGEYTTVTVVTIAAATAGTASVAGGTTTAATTVALASGASMFFPVVLAGGIIYYFLRSKTKE